MNNPSPYTSPQSPLSDNSADNKGSFLLGLFLPFVILIGGYAIVGAIVDFLDSIPHIRTNIFPFTVFGIGSLPILLFIGLVIYFVKKGKTRIVAGMATTFGLILLLVAACFGYFIIHPLNLH